MLTPDASGGMAFAGTACRGEGGGVKVSMRRHVNVCPRSGRKNKSNSVRGADRQCQLPGAPKLGSEGRVYGIQIYSPFAGYTGCLRETEGSSLNTNAAPLEKIPKGAFALHWGNMGA
jgi:hypothetical protein